MELSQQSPAIIGIDGYTRSKAVEDELNSLFAALFTRDAGVKILDYLQSITMHAVVPAHESEARLRHQEGMRDLFRIIKERTNKGKEGPNGGNGSSGGQRDKRSGRRRSGQQVRD